MSDNTYHYITLDVAQMRSVDTVYFRGSGVGHYLVAQITENGEKKMMESGTVCRLIATESLTTISGAVDSGKFKFPLSDITNEWNTCYIEFGTNSTCTQNFQIYAEVPNVARYDTIDTTNLISASDIAKLRSLPADAEANTLDYIKYGNTLVPIVTEEINGENKKVAKIIPTVGSVTFDPANTNTVFGNTVSSSSSGTSSDIVWIPPVGRVTLNGSDTDVNVAFDSTTNVNTADITVNAENTIDSLKFYAKNGNEPVAEATFDDRHISVELPIVDVQTKGNTTGDIATSVVNSGSVAVIEADKNYIDAITYNGTQSSTSTYNQNVSINAIDSVSIEGVAKYSASSAKHNIDFQPGDNASITYENSKIKIGLDTSNIRLGAGAINTGTAGQVLSTVQNGNSLETQWVNVSDLFDASGSTVNVVESFDVSSLAEITTIGSGNDCFVPVSIRTTEGGNTVYTNKKISWSNLLSAFESHFSSLHHTEYITAVIPSSGWVGNTYDVTIPAATLSATYNLTPEELNSNRAYVHVYPQASSIINYTNYGIYCSSVSANTTTGAKFTFTKNTTDSSPTNISVVIEVRIG